MLINNKSSKLPNMLAGIYSDSTTPKYFFIDDSNRVSYRDIKAQIAKTREMFRDYGLCLGGRLIIASSDKEFVAILYFSCLLEGVAAVVLDPDATAAELTVLLSRSEPNLALIDQGLIDNATPLQQENPAFEIMPIKRVSTRNSFSLILRRSTKSSAEEKEFSFPGILNQYSGVIDLVDVPEDTPGLILFTSGTTSQPKGVVLTHLNLQSQMQALVTQFRLIDSICLANHLPLHHTDGLNQGPLLTAVVKGVWLTHDVSTVPMLGDYLDFVYREQATHFITVPTVLAMMRLLPDEYIDCFKSRDFQFIESTAGYLSEPLWRDIEEQFEVSVVNCYGLTETVSEATYCGPSKSTRKVGTIGKPAGCELRLVDRNELIVSQGEIGELWVRGDIVMDSYFQDDESTKKAFEGDWFKTGDLAVCDEEGFYSIVGRLSSTIVRAGVNVYPENINSVLDSCYGVEASATIGLPDEMLGERVVSGVVVVSDQIEIESIYDHCMNLLAKEKIPNEILILPKLPYGPSGKVDLKALKEVIIKQGVKDNCSEDHHDVEHSLLLAASKVFRISVDKLSVESDPYSVKGWDSLAFLEFVMSLEKTFNIKLSAKDIMRIRSLGDALIVVNEHISGRRET